VPEEKLTAIEEACIARGMRMTGQRRVIARVLGNAQDHPDVEELYRRASTIDDKISISTVSATCRRCAGSTSRSSCSSAALPVPMRWRW
jgi:Fe2+ or Zn2+ uptake regulation protein